MAKRVLLPYRHASKLKAYEEAVRAGGMEPVGVSVTEPASLDGFAGLVLLGGADVNPQRYGEAPQPETDQPDDRRDRVELDLIEEAIQKDLPILAICRGLQILNVYQGGNLIQHLPTVERHDPEMPDKATPAHEVTIEPDSLLAQIAGEMRWQVNSRHHQAAGNIGPGLRVSARDTADGTVEGLERPDRRFVVAVQWHPEDQFLLHPEHLKLFQRFAEALD